MMTASRSTVDRFTVSENEQEKMMIDMQRLMAHAPHFAGLAKPAESVSLVRKVIENASIENEDGGSWVSQFGNKQRQ